MPSDDEVAAAVAAINKIGWKASTQGKARVALEAAEKVRHREWTIHVVKDTVGRESTEGKE